MNINVIKELGVNLLTSRPISSLMQPLRTRCIPVFMLHRFEDVEHGVTGHSLHSLEKALQYLAQSGYQSISVTALVQNLIAGHPIPKKAVAFTMDDGFYEQAKYALPMFERYKTHVTLFLATDMMDRSHWSWDYQVEYISKQTDKTDVNSKLLGLALKHPLANEKSRRAFVRHVRQQLKAQPIDTAKQELQKLAHDLNVSVPDRAPSAYQAISWQEIQALESDFIHFGAHTCSHSILSQLNEKESQREIEISWQRVKSEVVNPCPVFCYPTGRESIDFSDREKIFVKEAGLLGAFSADPGYILSSLELNDRYAFKRFAFPESHNQFKQYISWLERAKEVLIHA